MAQDIDFVFRERVTSKPMNERFRDITGHGVKHGFKLRKGSGAFSLTLSRDNHNESIAYLPSGTKVTETTDLINHLVVEPNTASAGLPRVDNIYAVYEHGSPTAKVNYIVIKGTNNNTPPQNPNIYTHLLLGSVRLFPGSEPILESNITNIKQGLAMIEVAGDAFFHGEAEFDGPVVFRGQVTFLDGTVGGDGESSGATTTYFNVLPTPIVATAGQTDFTLPVPYTMGKDAIFPYIDGKKLVRSSFIELNDRTIRLTSGQTVGAKFDCFWYNNLAAFTPAVHNHDERYYQKHEVSNRVVRSMTDYFNGMTGRVVSHNIGHKNYAILSVVPIEKTTDVGNISTEISDNDIKVYNTGAYRGKFSVSYQINNPLDLVPTPEHLGEYSVFSIDFDAIAAIYRIVEFKRKDGTLYARSTLSEPNVDGQYTNLFMRYYNSDGSRILRTEIWVLAYDADGRVTTKALQNVVR